MKQILRSLLIAFFLITLSNAQIIVMYDFEAPQLNFHLSPDYSGSSVGLLPAVPVLDTTTAAVGKSSIRITFIKKAESDSFACRYISNAGASAPGNYVMNTIGYTGYWLKTDRPGLKTAAALDAPGTAEIGDTTDVIGDGQWHLYQWNMEAQGEPYWNGWVTGNDTVNDSPTATYDAIWFWGSGFDTTIVYLDAISWNQNGFVPVELNSFEAVTVNNVVDLRWITSSELNNHGFEIERRTENSAYSTLGFVKGKGTTTQVNGYSYSDVVSEAGIYFYRLKQVDMDGTFDYSNEVMVNVVAMPGQYALAQNYPNPFNPSTSIEFVIPETGFANLAIFNLLGEKVVDLVNEIKESGHHTVTFDAGKLSSGTYIYTLSVNGNVMTKKMTLIK